MIDKQDQNVTKDVTTNFQHLQHLESYLNALLSAVDNEGLPCTYRVYKDRVMTEYNQLTANQLHSVFTPVRDLVSHAA